MLRTGYPPGTITKITFIAFIANALGQNQRAGEFWDVLRHIWSRDGKILSKRANLRFVQLKLQSNRKASFSLENKNIKPSKQRWRSLKKEGASLRLRGQFWGLKSLFEAWRAEVWRSDLSSQGVNWGLKGRIDISKFPCVLQDIGPLGPLPKEQGISTQRD